MNPDVFFMIGAVAAGAGLIIQTVKFTALAHLFFATRSGDRLVETKRASQQWHKFTLILILNLTLWAWSINLTAP